MLRGFEIGAVRWILEFTSKMGPGVGLPHPQGVAPDQKYWAWSTYPMGGSNHPSFVKIRDIEVRQVFGSCVEILLRSHQIRFHSIEFKNTPPPVLMRNPNVLAPPIFL